MSDYIKASDVDLLRDAGFTAGWSGESWFSPARETYYQAYPSTDNDLMVFVDQKDRVSRYVTRQQFQEMFGGAAGTGE